MKAFFQAFVNFEQNNWARLFPMAKFAYNNAKNGSIRHSSFKLNYGYHPCVFYKKGINLRSKSKSANELLLELQEFMTIYWKKL